MKRTAPYFVYAGMLVFTAIVSAHAGKGLFSLTIAAPPKEPLRKGDELRLLITVTNTSDQSIGFVRSPGPLPEEGFRYKIEVRDARGHAAPPSDYVRGLKGKTTANESISNIGRTLGPGETFIDQVTVTRYYDLSRPGRYSISLARPIEPWQRLGKGSVRSNVVTVTVTP